MEAGAEARCRRELPDPRDPAYFATLRDMVLCRCGDVCVMNRSQHAAPGASNLGIQKVVKKIDCPAILDATIVDMASNYLPPPADIPEALRDDFVWGVKDITNVYSEGACAR